jgi:tyrosine-specific transport protein
MIIPSTLVAIFIPNAFIRVLNFAGIILAIIAIILPIFLYRKMQKTTCPIANWEISATFAVGVIIIVLGIFDI